MQLQNTFVQRRSNFFNGFLCKIQTRSGTLFLLPSMYPHNSPCIIPRIMIGEIPLHDINCNFGDLNPNQVVLSERPQDMWGAPAATDVSTRSVLGRCLRLVVPVAARRRLVALRQKDVAEMVI